ncbi:MAG TPA: DUF1178 family protein [Caulobacteraceae bacterium]|jgi:hypothetical protein|nr:DUF1178 family protein [Caulobacteraceae bacterium]
MIKYALVCDSAHEFEGWFAASSDFEAQSERDLIACPVCASHIIRKQIMAPSVSGTKKRGQAVASAPGAKQAMMMEAMARVRAHVEDTFDYVGDTFAREARAIHEGKSDDRGIYGEATPAEVKGLVEDGVPVAALPPAPPKKNDVN